MSNISDTLVYNSTFLSHNKFQSHKKHAVYISLFVIIFVKYYKNSLYGSILKTKKSTMLIDVTDNEES